MEVDETTKQTFPERKKKYSITSTSLRLKERHQMGKGMVHILATWHIKSSTT